MIDRSFPKYVIPLLGILTTYLLAAPPLLASVGALPSALTLIISILSIPILAVAYFVPPYYDYVAWHVFPDEPIPHDAFCMWMDLIVEFSWFSLLHRLGVQ